MKGIADSQAELGCLGKWHSFYRVDLFLEQSLLGGGFHPRSGVLAKSRLIELTTEASQMLGHPDSGHI